jgi:hypothetical protein
MIHNVDRYKPHWRGACEPHARPGSTPASSYRSGDVPGLARCDVCRELYDPGHSYEVLHHLHGRRFEELARQ